MIYRNWSLLSSTVVIWGSVATAGLAGIFLFGGKDSTITAIPEFNTNMSKIRAYEFTTSVYLITYIHKFITPFQQ
ncbi:hypothetical protein ACQ4PT_033080 [Festuca glaucescens]